MRPWAIAALVMLSSCAMAKTAVGKARADCVLNAYTKYNETSVALCQRQGMSPTIEDITTKRRLMEAYCVEYVLCVNPPELMMGIESSSCLDAQNADRIKERENIK